MGGVLPVATGGVEEYTLGGLVGKGGKVASPELLDTGSSALAVGGDGLSVPETGAFDTGLDIAEIRAGNN